MLAVDFIARWRSLLRPGGWMGAPLPAARPANGVWQQLV